MRPECGCKVSLAGSGGPDPEDQRMRAHEVEIGGLRRRTGIGDTPRSRADRRRPEGGADGSRGLLAGKANLGVDLGKIASFATLQARIERTQHRGGALAHVRIALDGNEIAAHRDANVEFLLDTDEVPLMRSGETREQPVIGEFQGHLLLRRTFRSNGTQRLIAFLCAATKLPLRLLGNTASMRTR